MSEEKDSTAKSKTFMRSCSHGDCHDAEHKHGKPGLEPVDVILAVVQEVLSFSVVGGKSESLSEWVEFFQSWEKQKHAHCDNVQVKGNDLVAQPGHNLRVINHSISTLIEDDACLKGEVSEEVGENFDQHEHSSKDFDSLFVHEITGIMTNYSHKMCQLDHV